MSVLSVFSSLQSLNKTNSTLEAGTLEPLAEMNETRGMTSMSFAGMCFTYRRLLSFNCFVCNPIFAPWDT